MRSVQMTKRAVIMVTCPVLIAVSYILSSPEFGKGWFSNTSFTTGLKTLPTFRPDALVFFRAKMQKKTRASGRNVGKVFNPVVKLVLENQPFLMPEPAEKPSLHPSELELVSSPASCTLMQVPCPAILSHPMQVIRRKKL